MREKKRVMQGLSLLLLVAILMTLAVSYSKKRELATIGEERYQVTFFDAFDTKTEIIGYGTNEEAFQEQAQKLKEKLMFYHRQYDIYYDYEGINNLKTINDNAGIAPVKVDASIIQLLKLSSDMYHKTQGKINIAMGSVLSIWHSYRINGVQEPQKAALPTKEELAEAGKHMEIANIVIDEAASTVYLKDAEMSLDVGGIGKGYAVQQTAAYAKALGMENVLLSVGGNICAVGTRGDGAAWRMGIQNPDLTSAEAYVQKVAFSDASLVTSGSYQRYYEVGGKRYCHIIQPDTLMPAEYFDSVSILAKDSGVADALSTAVFNMPLEEGLQLIRQLEDVEAMWILKDGSIKYSDKFEAYVIP